MRMRPTAMGIEVVPTLKDVMKSVVEGAKYPRATPKPIARNIQSVRNLSRNDRRSVAALAICIPLERRSKKKQDEFPSEVVLPRSH